MIFCEGRDIFDGGESWSICVLESGEGYILLHNLGGCATVDMFEKIGVVLFGDGERIGEGGSDEDGSLLGSYNALVGVIAQRNAGSQLTEAEYRRNLYANLRWLCWYYGPIHEWSCALRQYRVYSESWIMTIPCVQNGEVLEGSHKFLCWLRC